MDSAGSKSFSDPPYSPLTRGEHAWRATAIDEPSRQRPAGRMDQPRQLNIAVPVSPLSRRIEAGLRSSCDLSVDCSSEPHCLKLMGAEIQTLEERPG